MPTRRLAITLGTLTALALVLGAISAVPASGAEPDPARQTTARASAEGSLARAQPRAKRHKRGLKVKVIRPSAAKKLVKVTVVGPKRAGKKRFRKTIRRTKTWKNARPGVYRIKATRIDLFDQRVKPAVSRKKVRIPKKLKRKVVRVRYRTPAFCGRTGSTLLAWGDNQFGQLGTTGGADSPRPRANGWLRGVTAVTGGLRTSYALCRDGSVWAWGFNGNGELGIGGPGDRTWPVRVKGLTSVVEIAAGDQAAYALRSDGSVWAWGYGRYGQLGNGRSGFGYDSRVPVRVQLPGPASTIAAGGHTAYAALRADGAVMAWGNGGVGQRGNGTTAESTPVPVRATGLSGVAQLAAGHVTVYARTTSGALHAWGGNNQGEIAGLSASSTAVPWSIATSGAEVIGASHSAGYAEAAGARHGWGSGRHHDTGRDSGGSPDVLASIPALAGLPVRAFAGAGYGAYALLSNGTVWGWGDHGQGQVGTGESRTGPSATEGLLPAPIPGLTAVTAIGAGVVNGYAVR